MVGAKSKEVGEERLYLMLHCTLHCDLQNDLCSKMGSEESPFAVSLTEGQSRKTVCTDHNFWRERWAKAEMNQGPLEPNNKLYVLLLFHRNNVINLFLMEYD